MAVAVCAGAFLAEQGVGAGARQPGLLGDLLPADWRLGHLGGQQCADARAGVVGMVRR